MESKLIILKMTYEEVFNCICGMELFNCWLSECKVVTIKDSPEDCSLYIFLTHDKFPQVQENASVTKMCLRMLKDYMEQILIS